MIGRSLVTFSLAEELLRDAIFLLSAGDWLLDFAEKDKHFWGFCRMKSFVAGHVFCGLAFFSPLGPPAGGVPNGYDFPSVKLRQCK